MKHTQKTIAFKNSRIQTQSQEWDLNTDHAALDYNNPFPHKHELK